MMNNKEMLKHIRKLKKKDFSGMNRYRHRSHAVLFSMSEKEDGSYTLCNEEEVETIFNAIHEQHPDYITIVELGRTVAAYYKEEE